MKRNLVIAAALFAVFFVFSVVPAFAQETDPTPPIPPVDVEAIVAAILSIVMSVIVNPLATSRFGALLLALVKKFIPDADESVWNVIIGVGLFGVMAIVVHFGVQEQFNALLAFLLAVIPGAIGLGAALTMLPQAYAAQVTARANAFAQAANAQRAAQANHSARA